jgi:hypothetical protein
MLGYLPMEPDIATRPSLPWTPITRGKKESVRLEGADGELRCGAFIVNTRNGDILHWIRFEGAVRELFDLAFIPGVLTPMCVGLCRPRISHADYTASR